MKHFYFFIYFLGILASLKVVGRGETKGERQRDRGERGERS